MSLYSQVGGEPAISLVVTDFYDRMSHDELLGQWFVDADGASIQFHLRAYLAVALGGPEQYSGRSLRIAHQGLRITGAAWDAVLVTLTESLRSANVDERVTARVVAIITTFRAVIVEVP